MPDRPGVLVRLLESRSARDQEEAWAALVHTHTDALLRTARYFGGDHDAVMDRYAFILEHLRQDQFSRLRRYAPQERATFEVWAGSRGAAAVPRPPPAQVRPGVQAGDESATLERAGRGDLVDLLGEVLEVSSIPDPAGRDLGRSSPSGSCGRRCLGPGNSRSRRPPLFTFLFRRISPLVRSPG